MTDTSIRLFIALPLPPSLQRMLSDWSEELRLKLPFRKWVHSSDLHITLQFLGSTPSQQIDAIKSALRSGIATSPESFELKLERLRLFGRPDNPSVLWVGVSGELGPLHALQQAVASVLAPLGIELRIVPTIPILHWRGNIMEPFPSTTGCWTISRYPRLRRTENFQAGQSMISFCTAAA